MYGSFWLVLGRVWWRSGHDTFLGPSDFGQFPVIPIPFCLRFQEGSAMMRLVPLKDLDSFASLCLSMTGPRQLSEGPRVSSPIEDSLESSEEDRGLMFKYQVTSQRRSSPASQSFFFKEEGGEASSETQGNSLVLDIEESKTEEEVVPPPSKCLKSSKSAPTSSKASHFLPALLIDDQGRLKLPGDLVGEFTPFKRFEHAQNSAPLQRQNPIFDVNPEFLNLGAILTTQKASFTMQDLLLKCMCLLDVDLAMNALNALHVATTSSTINITNSLRRTRELRMQLDRLGTLFDQARQLFLQSFLDLQLAGQDPIVVLEALKAAEPQHESLSIEDWTVLGTLFQWSSPFNLNGLQFNNQTPAEWIDLLCSIHSGTSSAKITPDGHLIDALQPLEPAVEVSEALDTQGSPPITTIEKDSGVKDITSLPEGSPIQTELDLPRIESLTKPTPSPEKGI
ncbi:hypothetical protein F5877DRAFT_72991 [Lentinula edodes]|nr:hypothetical protein F5877DRAFT_72991 [Lentinula edodes]